MIQKKFFRKRWFSFSVFLILSFFILRIPAQGKTYHVIITVENRVKIVFNGKPKAGHITTSSNGYAYINPGFDFEKGKFVSGFGGSDVQLSTDENGQPTLQGNLEIVPQETKIVPDFPTRHTIRVYPGELLLDADSAGNYVLVAIDKATPQWVEFLYLKTAAIQPLTLSSSKSSETSSRKQGGMHSGAAQAPQTLESTYSHCFRGTVGASSLISRGGTGEILFDSYTPTGAVFNKVDPYGDSISQTVEQLIKVYAYNPSTHLVGDSGDFTSHDLPRMTFYGGKTVKRSVSQFTILYKNGRKKIYKVNNAILGGSFAANWSPDGRYLAFQGGGSENGMIWMGGVLYVMDTQTGAVCTVIDPEKSKLTVLDSHWLPQGGLVFSTRSAFYQTSPDLKHYQKLPVDTGGKLQNSGRFDLSPDGKLIAWTGENNDGINQIWISRLDGTGKIQLTHGQTGDRSPHFSPNGNELVYLAASKRFIGELRVVRIDGTGDHPLTGGGGKPIELVADIEQWVPERGKPSSLTVGSGYQMYKNSLYGFSVLLPQAWIWRPSKNKILAGSPHHHAAVVVIAERFPHPVTLDHFFSLVMEYLKQKSRIKIYKTGKGFIKGAPSHWAVYTSKVNGKILLSEMYVIVIGLKAYAITTVTRINLYQEYRKTFLHIVKSFQF